MRIYCTGCEKEVDARLTDGAEMYPHRPDLASLPFWVCECGAFVGTHHKTSDRTKPLGVLATKELKRIRMAIHAILDPLWKEGKVSRAKVYAHVSKKLGKSYHTGELRSLEEGRRVYEIAKQFKDALPTT